MDLHEANSYLSYELGQICTSSPSLLISGQWFDAAASIEKISVNTARWNPEAVMMCRPAADYENARSDFYEPYFTTLSSFMFIWAGAESLAEALSRSLRNTRNSQQHKPIPFTGWLTVSGRWPSSCSPPLATDIEKLLLRTAHIAANIPEYERSNVHNVAGNLKANHGWSQWYGAIWTVGQIRQDFAHGGAIAPDYDNWEFGNRQIDHYRELVELSASLVLLIAKFWLACTVDEEILLEKSYWPVQDKSVAEGADPDFSDMRPTFHDVLLAGHPAPHAQSR